MKIPVLLLLCAGLLPASRAADPSLKLAPADGYAFQFVSAHPHSTAGLAEFLRKQGLQPGKKRAEDVGSRVPVMQTLISDGVELGSAAFWLEYHATFATADEAPSQPPPSASTVSPAPASEVDKLVALVREDRDDAKTKEAAKKAEAEQTEKEAIQRAQQIPFASFMTGVRTVSPYTIVKVNDTTGYLDASSSNTQAYIEFVFNNKWAWDGDKVGRTKAHAGDGGDQAASQWFPVFNRLVKPMALRDDVFDFSARLGYDFSTGSTPTATTIAGTGDFSAEFTTGFQLYRGWADTTAYSIDLVGSWAGVTDRSSMRIHNRWLVGPGINFGFSDPAFKRRAVLSLRAGLLYTRVDQVLRGPLTTMKISDASDAKEKTFRPVLMEDGHPLYGHAGSDARKPRFSSFEAELNYPISKSAYLTLGTRFYGHIDPDLWSVSIGATFPFATLISTFGPESKASP